MRMTMMGWREEDWVGRGLRSDGQASVEREKIEGVTGWALGVWGVWALGMAWALRGGATGA